MIEPLQRRKQQPAQPGQSGIFSLRVTPRLNIGHRNGGSIVKITCTVPPVSRANLLVGKLLLLHQTRPGFAKEFPHNRPEMGNPLQCDNSSRHKECPERPMQFPNPTFENFVSSC